MDEGELGHEFTSADELENKQILEKEFEQDDADGWLSNTSSRWISKYCYTT
jgi:uncharacterized cupredoxin-like copper-binding protein